MVTNSYGCSDEKEIQINAYTEAPDVNIFGDIIDCNKRYATVSYTSLDNIENVNWSSNNPYVNFQDSIQVENEGWYSVEVENEYGCTNEASFYVEAYLDSPIINVGPSDTIIVNVEEPNVELLINVISNSDYEVSWFPLEGLSCYNCINPTLLDFGSSYYDISVINEYGCLTESTLNIVYKRPLKIEIPNIFSPSKGDGANDFFTIYGNENVDIVNQMLIYDRWGNLVAENYDFEPNIPSLGWDGQINGKLGQSGVYVYAFKITTIQGFVLEYYGTVTLI